MTSISSSSNTSVPPSWLSESNTSLRDASFSSYLNSSEETYIRNLVQTSQSQSQNHLTTAKQHDPLYSSRSKKVEDGEIDVFSADKYFKGEIVREHDTPRSVKTRRQQSRKILDDKVVMSSLSKLKLQPRTPSSHSESSWNSQSALLRRLQSNPSRGTKNNNNSSSNTSGKRSFLSCYCCDKKSVDIENNDDQEYFRANRSNSGGFGDLYERGATRTIKTSLDTAEITRLNKIRRQQQQHIDIDSLVLPAPECLTAATKKIDFRDEEEQEKRRKSLEVFGYNEMDDEGSKRFSLENKLNMLSWDAIPRSSLEDMNNYNHDNTSGPPSETHRDSESDASSDLFEIECLPCTVKPVVQGQRQASGGCATPTTAYAPSEASIEWSVVTASAADFSIVSDYDEQRSVLTSVSRRRMGPKPPSSSSKTTVNKEGRKPRSTGMLTGCKSQKAVRVAGDSYRSTPVKGKSDSQKTQRFSDSYSPVTRFHAEAKLPVYGLRQTKTTSSSDLLYVQ